MNAADLASLAAAIKTASSLDALCDALNDAADEGAIKALDEQNLVDFAMLPTYSADEPESTVGIWSWDASRELVTDGDRWELIERPMWDCFHDEPVYG